MSKQLVPTGSSLLSTMIVLCLSTPLLTLGLTTIISASSRYYKILQLKSENHATLSISSFVQKAVEELDTHRLSELLRVHALGAIYYTDGTLNHVSSNLNFTPALNSNALSSAKLAPRALLEVVDQQDLSFGHRLKACLKYQDLAAHKIINAFTLADSRAAFLALHADGMSELIGSVSSIGDLNSRPCWLLDLTQTKSMIVPTFNAPPAATISFIKLIPILAEYTLYIDRLGSFRYLAHYAGQNIENQPIVKNIEALAIATKLSTTAKISYLDATITFPSRSKQKLIFSHHIAHTSYFNFLMN